MWVKDVDGRFVNLNQIVCIQFVRDGHVLAFEPGSDVSGKSKFYRLEMSRDEIAMILGIDPYLIPERKQTDS